MKTLSRALISDRIEIAASRVTLPRPWYFSCLLILIGMIVCAAAPGSLTYGATPAASPAASATSTIGKEVELNGTPMPAGATLYPGDVIRLGDASTAALRFGNSLVLAGPLTEFIVEAEGVRLRNGQLQVRAGRAESFSISGQFFHVNMAAYGGIPSSAEIRLWGTRLQVSAVAGAANLKGVGSGAFYRLHAGETATLDAAGGDASPAQGASSPAAGQVSRLIPQVQIDRASQTLLATLFERVYWNDGLRSGPTGRAHVTLKDGSQLNLGSDSSLRILQHDAQAQQTSLDLLIGRMRGKITKLTRPGAKFEIHTPMGVAGLVGTDFSLLAMDDFTELMVFEGAVRFTTLNGQSITVTAGMKLRISKDGVIIGPTPTTPQEVQIAQGFTDINGPAGTAPVVAATTPVAPLVITLAGSAAAVGIGVWQGMRGTVSPVIP